MKNNKIILSLIFIMMVITLSSCTNKSSKSNPKPDETKSIISSIEECERELINLMSEIDLVPYYKKQINEKKIKEKGEKEMKLAAGTQKKEEDSGQSPNSANDEFKPKPVTDNDTLLLKLLMEEKSIKTEFKDQKKIPEDIVFIWHEISKSIDDIHIKWNDLKPKLKKEKVSSKAISGFDGNLNSLTISSTANEYLESLVNANTLSSYLTQFIRDLKDKNLASIYSIKYHSRQIVLNAASGDYSSIKENIKAVKSEQKILTTELKKKKKDKELEEKLSLSIINLEDAISLKDINVIKVKASIVVKNINSMQEKLLM